MNDGSDHGKELERVTGKLRRLETLFAQQQSTLSPTEREKRQRTFALAKSQVERDGILVGLSKKWQSRAYQLTVVLHILEWASKRPTGRLLVVLPPAGGKTLVLAATLRVLVALGLRVLIVVHRRELINQHHAHLIECGLPPEHVGVIMRRDRRTNPNALVQLASIDTLRRRPKAQWPCAEVVLTDEAHRDASDTRRELRAHYHDALRLGITATPHRLDGRGLAMDFDEMIVGATIGALILDGYVAAPRVFTVPEDMLPDVRRLRIVHGDYERGALGRAAMRKHLIGEIVAHWLRLAENRKTVVFAASIKHSKRIVAAFRKAGVRRVAHLDNHTPSRTREALLDAFRHGELTIISCVDVLSEGWDCDRCKCVIQARPTLSYNLHIQQTARAMRPWCGITPLVLDHAGNTLVHRLPQMEVPWMLEAPFNIPTSRPTAKVCRTCYAIVALTERSCPECHTAFPEKVRLPDERPGDLCEYVLDDEDKQADLDRLWQFADAKGLSEEWVRRVFEVKFGLPLTS